MSASVWLGIDIGTSGCRIIAIDAQQQIIFKNQADFLLNQPYPDPQQQWQIVSDLLKKTVTGLADAEIVAIAVDATSGSVLICDNNGQPLTDMLLYNDQRALEQSWQINKSAPENSAARGAGSGLAKFMYLQQQSALPTHCYLIHQADFINAQLGAKTGITDYNNALKSGFDPQLMRWPDWLEKLTSHHFFPEVVAPGTVIGEMSAKLMQTLNLQQTIKPKIIAGTTDSMAAFIATGAIKTGEGVTSLGSTLVLKMISDKAVFAPEFGIYSHKLGNHWLVGGASNSGGAVLRQFFSDEEIAAISEQIDLQDIPPDYYPLPSTGERFPIADINLSPRLTPRPASDSLFLHGIFHGIANIEQQGYVKLQQLCGTTLQSIRSVGGGAVNPVCTQIRQQKLAVPFLTALNTQAAYGAALLAKNGLNAFN